MKATVTITSSSPCEPSSSRMCSMHGLPTIGTIGFGWFEGSGGSRVPPPPALTTAFPRTPPPSRRPSREPLPLRLQRVLRQRDEREAEPDPEDPERPRRPVMGHHHESE